MIEKAEAFSASLVTLVHVGGHILLLYQKKRNVSDLSNAGHLRTGLIRALVYRSTFIGFVIYLYVGFLVNELDKYHDSASSKQTFENYDDLCDTQETTGGLSNSGLGHCHST